MVTLAQAESSVITLASKRDRGVQRPPSPTKDLPVVTSQCPSAATVPSLDAIGPEGPTGRRIHASYVCVVCAPAHAVHLRLSCTSTCQASSSGLLRCIAPGAPESSLAAEPHSGRLVVGHRWPSTDAMQQPSSIATSAPRRAPRLVWLVSPGPAWRRGQTSGMHRPHSPPSCVCMACCVSTPALSGMWCCDALFPEKLTNNNKTTALIYTCIHCHL